MKTKWDNQTVLLWSAIVAIVSASYLIYRDGLLGLFFTVPYTLFIFVVWIFVRWVASTAEKAGRSYVGFMIIAILFPFIAWLIVLLFKKPETPATSV